MDIISNFSENLAWLIHDKNLTYTQFAESVKINAVEVYRYLNKEYLPNLSNIIKIAQVYNCSIDSLLGLAPYSNKTAFKEVPPFSQSFKNLLEERGVTRYRLSKQTGISSTRIDDWFNGKRLPTIDNAIVLAKFFDCSLDYLLGRE